MQSIMFHFIVLNRAYTLLIIISLKLSEIIVLSTLAFLKTFHGFIIVVMKEQYLLQVQY